MLTHLTLNKEQNVLPEACKNDSLYLFVTCWDCRTHLHQEMTAKPKLSSKPRLCLIPFDPHTWMIEVSCCRKSGDNLKDEKSVICILSLKWFEKLQFDTIFFRYLRESSSLNKMYHVTQAIIWTLEPLKASCPDSEAQGSHCKVVTTNEEHTYTVGDSPSARLLATIL